MLSVKEKYFKTLRHEKVCQKIDPKSLAALKWAGTRRISKLQNFEVRLGGWNVETFCGRRTEACEQLKKEISG